MNSKLSAALAATCIAAAITLAPAQGQADFLFQDLTATNPGTFPGGAIHVPLTFVPDSFNRFDTSIGTLTDVDIILSFGFGATWTSDNNTSGLGFSLNLNGNPSGTTFLIPGAASPSGFFGLPNPSFFEGTGTISFGVEAFSVSDGTLTGDSIVAHVRYEYTPAAPVPGPVVGAGIPGLIAGCFTLLGLARRRRRQAVA